MLICIVGSILFELPMLLAIPALPLLIICGLKWPSSLIYMLFLSLPLSIEFFFSDSLATDLPTEPLMIGVSLLFILWALLKPQHLLKRKLTHPITLLLGLHLIWIAFSTFLGNHPLVGLKFFLAKSWYVIALFLAPLFWLDEVKMMKLIKACAFVLVPIAAFILFKHYLDDFSFESAIFVMKPFFRNHVIYAIFLLMLIPFTVYFAYQAEKKSKQRYFWIGASIVLLAAMNFNYTRAAYVGLVALVPAFAIIHFRLMKIALAATLAIFISFVAWVSTDNKFMDFAPDYETTIAHDNIEDLLTATLKGKDISTMERIYRWVAGYFMIQDRPLIGFGPGSFYESYWPYTVFSFRTYVSDNPERSGIHCYYLLLWTEQGLVGLLIFVGLIFYAFLFCEKLYHRSESRSDRLLVLLVFSILFTISLMQIINDIVESDKVGTLFFWALAFLVMLDQKINRALPR